ncbi:MAG: hypothetical protein Q7T03_06850 [Deltaproteobacteria bacterium]|nr:hypothetical protein [Deltaproteobacteria bacterium]
MFSIKLFSSAARQHIDAIHPGGFKAFEAVLTGAGLSVASVFQKAAGTFKSIIGINKGIATANSAARFGSIGNKMGNPVPRAESLASILDVLPKPVAEKLAVAWFKNVAAKDIPIQGKQEIAA